MTRILTLIAPLLLVGCDFGDLLGSANDDAFTYDRYDAQDYDYGFDSGDYEPSTNYATQAARLSGELPTVGVMDDAADPTITSVYLDDWMVDLHIEIRNEDGTFGMMMGRASLDKPLETGEAIALPPTGFLGCSGVDSTFDFDQEPVSVLVIPVATNNGIELTVVFTFDGLPDLVGVAQLDEGE